MDGHGRLRDRRVGSHAAARACNPRRHSYRVPAGGPARLGLRDTISGVIPWMTTGSSALREQVRRRTSGGDIYDPEFRKVADSPIPGRQAQMALRGSGDPAGRALPAGGRAAGICRARRGAGRRADGPRRHQPRRRAPRPARRARHRAHRPVRSRAADARRLPSCGSPTSATCRSAAASAWRAATRTSRRFYTSIVDAGVVPLSVGGDHSITLSDPEGRRREAGRSAWCISTRIATRRGPYEGIQVPSWRAVPPGGARRRARSRAHHPDRHPRRRPNICGSSPTTAA